MITDELEREGIPYSVRFEPDQDVWIARVAHEKSFVMGIGESTESMMDALEQAYKNYNETIDELRPRSAGYHA